MKLLFSGGSVYDADRRVFIRSDLLVIDGKIAENLGSAAEDAETVDCDGKYLIPGLVDVHTHGRAGHDWCSSDGDAADEMRRSYAAVGTTTVMATLASDTVEGYFRAADVINSKRTATPGLTTVAGIHLEGRYLNPKKRGAHNSALLSTPDDGMIGELIERMKPLPLHVSAAAELDTTGGFIAEVTASGATFGIAHTDATFDEAETAVSRGATSFTHTFNCMRAIHHREPGVAVCSLLSDGAYTELICDGEHVHPAMIKMASRLKPRDRVVLITDSMEAAGAGDGKYKIGGLDVIVRDGRAYTVEGALAGSTLDLFTALVNYMKFTGLTLEEALPAATSNPAAMVGIGDVCGKLAPGMRADVIIIDSKDTPSISAVYAAGGIAG